ncbi:MAG: zf-HC2 domain-containing protein [Woeseiaceae bacterium]
MDTHTSDQLSHEEALELLPWHINATLETAMSERVAHHVEHCSACQEESAILSNTVVALNTGDQVTTNLDARFAGVLGRVRAYEQSDQATARPKPRPIGERIAEWLGLPIRRMQWAGAFALGLAVGLGALLFTLQSDDLTPSSASIYGTHSSGQAPLRLQLDLDHAPGASELSELKQTVSDRAIWQQVSDTQFLIELPDELTVKDVSDIRSQLLGNDSVVNVAIDIGSEASERGQTK